MKAKEARLLQASDVGGQPPRDLRESRTVLNADHNVAAQNPAVMQKIDAICREAYTPERVFEPADREGVADYVR